MRASTKILLTLFLWLCSFSYSFAGYYIEARNDSYGNSNPVSLNPALSSIQLCQAWADNQAVVYGRDINTLSVVTTLSPTMPVSGTICTFYNGTSGPQDLYYNLFSYAEPVCVDPEVLDPTGSFCETPPLQDCEATMGQEIGLYGYIDLGITASKDIEPDFTQATGYYCQSGCKAQFDWNSTQTMSLSNGTVQWSAYGVKKYSSGINADLICSTGGTEPILTPDISQTDEGGNTSGFDETGEPTSVTSEGVVSDTPLGPYAELTKKEENDDGSTTETTINYYSDGSTTTTTANYDSNDIFVSSSSVSTGGTSSEASEASQGDVDLFCESNPDAVMCAKTEDYDFSTELTSLGDSLDAQDAQAKIDAETLYGELTQQLSDAVNDSASGIETDNKTGIESKLSDKRGLIPDTGNNQGCSVSLASAHQVRIGTTTYTLDLSRMCELIETPRTFLFWFFWLLALIATYDSFFRIQPHRG